MSMAARLRRFIGWEVETVQGKGTPGDPLRAVHCYFEERPHEDGGMVVPLFEVAPVQVAGPPCAKCRHFRVLPNDPAEIAPHGVRCIHLQPDGAFSCFEAKP